MRRGGVRVKGQGQAHHAAPGARSSIADGAPDGTGRPRQRTSSIRSVSSDTARLRLAATERASGKQMSPAVQPAPLGRQRRPWWPPYALMGIFSSRVEKVGTGRPAFRLVWRYVRSRSNFLSCRCISCACSTSPCGVYRKLQERGGPWGAARCRHSLLGLTSYLLLKSLGEVVAVLHLLRHAVNQPLVVTVLDGRSGCHCRRRGGEKMSINKNGSAANEAQGGGGGGASASPHALTHPSPGAGAACSGPRACLAAGR